jgi:hypothetical protein
MGILSAIKLAEGTWYWYSRQLYQRWEMELRYETVPVHEELSWTSFLHGTAEIEDTNHLLIERYHPNYSVGKKNLPVRIPVEEQKTIANYPNGVKIPVLQQYSHMETFLGTEWESDVPISVLFLLHKTNSR